MGLFNMTTLAGALRRGSEIMQEERKSAYDLVDQNMSDWTRLGVPEIKKRKQLRTKMKTAGEFLRNKGFSSDQIDVAFQQGKYEEVVQHITNLEAAQKDNPELQYKPADIIKLGPNYEDSGRTMDEVLDGVMGKVGSGMSTADAIADMGGKGLQGAFMRNRMDAAATASGFDVNTLRAIATGDLEYSEPIAGDISIVDPVASAQAQSALEGGETGQPGIESMQSTLFNFGADLVGGKSNVTSGGILYDFEQPDRRIALNSWIADALAKRGQNRFSAQDRNELMGELQSWAIDQGYYAPSAKNGTDTTIPSFDFSGDPATITSDFIKSIEGIEDEAARAAAFDAASAAALESLLKKHDPQTAREKHNEFIKDLLAKMKQKSTNVSGNPKSVTVKKDAPGIVVGQ